MLSTVSLRFFSPNASIASASSRKTTCLEESMGRVCAWSSAACVSPQSAEKRETAQARAASWTKWSIKTTRHLSRRYGSSPNKRIAEIFLSFSRRAANSRVEMRAISSSPSPRKPAERQSPWPCGQLRDHLPEKSYAHRWKVRTRCERYNCCCDRELFG